MMCWAPLVLTGYFMGIETSWHTQPDASGVYAEAQTCRDGLGAHIKAGIGEWLVGGVHYGITTELSQGWTATIQPAVGLSYFNRHHPVNGQRQIGRFEVGLGVLISNGRVVIGAEYLHMSNGEGTTPTNIGIDGVGVKVGRIFSW